MINTIEEQNIINLKQCLENFKKLITDYDIMRSKDRETNRR